MARIKIALQVVPVRVYCESGKSIETYALLDTGSEESFLTRSLAEKLNLKEKSFDTLTVCTLAGESMVNVGQTDVTVEPLENPEHRKLRMEDIRIVERLNVKAFKPSDLSRWPHLSGIRYRRRHSSDWCQHCRSSSSRRKSYWSNRRTICCLHYSRLGNSWTSRTERK